MINVLIAIIINSMEEVHEVEKRADRAELDDEIADQQGVTVAERMHEIREAIDKLELQLAEGGGDLPGPARSVRRRPTKGGADARLVAAAAPAAVRGRGGLEGVHRGLEVGDLVSELVDVVLADLDLAVGSSAGSEAIVLTRHSSASIRSLSVATSSSAASRGLAADRP